MQPEEKAEEENMQTDVEEHQECEAISSYAQLLLVC